MVYFIGNKIYLFYELGWVSFLFSLVNNFWNLWEMKEFLEISYVFVKLYVC